MRLSKEQITQIDETLVLNKVVYDDIKLELTDHIASDIETMMADEEIPFESAFKKAFGKWRVQLKEETFSFIPLVFFWKSAPKMIVDKWYKETRVQLLYSVLISLSLTGLILLMNKSDNYIINTFEELCKRSYVAMLFILAIGRILMFKTNVKTTSGNMFKIYFVIYLFLGLDISDIVNHFHFSFKPDTFSPPVALFFIVHSSFSLRLLYKHFQFERKLKTV